MFLLKNTKTYLKKNDRQPYKQLMDHSSKMLSNLDIPIPENVFSYSPQQQDLIYKYLVQMDESQKQTYLIAKDHLETSFNIVKSNGYVRWFSEYSKGGVSG